MIYLDIIYVIQYTHTQIMFIQNAHSSLTFQFIVTFRIKYTYIQYCFYLQKYKTYFYTIVCFSKVTLLYVYFGGIKANKGDFGLGADKRQKSFPPVPLTTPIKRNVPERDFLATFRTDFLGLCLDWKKIRSETWLKKSNPKRRVC